MSTITSYADVEWTISKRDNGRVVIGSESDSFNRIFKVEDILAALRTEGVMPADDDAAGKLREFAALADEWEAAGRLYAHDAVVRLRGILNPFELPKGLGAVIEVERTTTGLPFLLVKTENAWLVSDKIGAPHAWNEAGIRDELTVLRVLSEGVTA